MDVLKVSLVALVLARATFCAHPVDQYLQDRPYLTQQELQKQPHRRVAEATVEASPKREKRRVYYDWQTQGETNGGSNYAVWNPAVYQINRPYLIPVWGGGGRLPIYYPPQPIRPYPPAGSNAYLPPKGYLPPRATTPSYEEDSSVSIVNRNQFDEDAPVWDVIPGNGQALAPPAISSRPTRRPGGRTTPPPLFHKNTNNTGGNSLSIRPPQNSGQGFARPPLSNLPPPPPTPPPTSQSTESRQPSSCVWAIISCCSAGTQNISYSCFEQLGCMGAFWDTSPCESDFARAAIAAAAQYFNAKKK